MKHLLALLLVFSALAVQAQNFRSLSPNGEALFDEKTKNYPQFNESKAAAEASLIKSDSADFKDKKEAFIRNALDAYQIEKTRKLEFERAALLRKYPALDERRLADIFQHIEPSTLRFSLMNEAAGLYGKLLPLPDGTSEPLKDSIKILLKKHPEIVLEGSWLWLEKTLSEQKAKAKEAAAKKLWRNETRRLMPKAATPEVDPDGGQFDPRQAVVLSCPTPGASIYYTLDGSTPDESSQLYVGPLKLKQAATMRAIAIHPEMNDSELVKSAPWTGLGLYASYFDRLGFNGTTGTRIDPELDFDWVSSSPDPAIPADFFSAIWAGSLCAPETGDYTLYIVAADGIRLWIDGRLLMDSWNAGALKERSAKTHLEAGRPANIKIAYCAFGSTPKIRLDWSSPTLRRRQVPSACLIAKGGYADELLRWNERQGGAYVNRQSMQNPGAVEGNPLFKGVAEPQQKLK